MLLPISQYLEMNVERDFRDRRNTHRSSGAREGIVQVVTRPKNHQWDVYIPAGNCVWKVRAIFTAEGDLTHEEKYTIRDGTIVPASEAVIVSEISLPAKLNLIRSQFGISTKDLADALNVERPTVYAWQKESSKPQDRHRERIEILVELAKYWKSLSERPLNKSIFEPMNNGRSVMDMLKAEEMPISDIKIALRQWANDQEARRTLLQQKAAEQRESMEKRGIKPLPDHVVDQSLRDFSQTSI